MADETIQWSNLHSTSDFRFLVMDTFQMPIKDAGVGLARKRGMDEAVYRFNVNNNPCGIILCFDADCCCDTNYLTAIERKTFAKPGDKRLQCLFRTSIFFSRHNTSKSGGFLCYEMHLRCFNLYTRFTGFPFAFHTIGSCFGVRAAIYTQQGGMNNEWPVRISIFFIKWSRWETLKKLTKQK